MEVRFSEELRRKLKEEIEKKPPSQEIIDNMAKSIHKVII